MAQLGTYLALTGERLQGTEVIGLGLATHYLPSTEYETLMHHLTGLAFEDHISQEERDEIIHEAIAELETDEAVQEVDPGASTHLSVCILSTERRGS